MCPSMSCPTTSLLTTSRRGSRKTLRTIRRQFEVDEQESSLFILLLRRRKRQLAKEGRSIYVGCSAVKKKAGSGETFGLLAASERPVF